MTDLFDQDPAHLLKFGVGQRAGRKEDPILLRGKGRYTDDINLPGQAYAAVVRSDHAHGIIRSIDTADAAAMPGVLGVFTGADLVRAGCQPMPNGVSAANYDGSPMRWSAWRALPPDRVRHVGEPVAFVVAETVAQAREAAEAVVVDIEPLPAVTTAEDAMKPDAPQIHPDIPGNVAIHYRTGDAGEGRRRLRRRRPRHPPRYRQQPDHRQRDGAARRARRLRFRRPAATPSTPAPRASSSPGARLPRRWASRPKSSVSSPAMSAVPSA